MTVTQAVSNHISKLISKYISVETLCKTFASCKGEEDDAAGLRRRQDEAVRM